jgi:hypothetical protein
MPAPVSPELAELQQAFAGEHEAWLGSAEGKRSLKLVTAFARNVGELGLERVLGSDSRAGAQAVQAWLARCPEKLLDMDSAPWLSVAELKPKQAASLVAGAMQTLAVGAKALLVAGADKRAKRAPEQLLRVVLGGDAISAALRKPFAPSPKLPLPGPGLSGWPVPEQIHKLVLAGTLRELIATFARCGLQAQQENAWAQAVRPLGQVTLLKPARACAGDALTVHFSGFGTTPPTPGSDVVLAIPARPGCRHFAFSQVAPGLLGAGWQDSGSLTVTLPVDVFTGAVGCFLVPPPLKGDGGCEAGGLATAAAGLQSVLADVFGPAGVMTGQVVLQVALHAEAGRHQGLPCASGQPGAPNWLLAGLPVITEFRQAQDGPIHPEVTLTLVMAVENGDAASLAVRPVPGCANAHELPTMPFIAARSGSVVLQVPCTRRWEADIVLSVTNANGCKGQPVERVLRVRSGFSHWRLGVGRADISDLRPGLGMAGFAYKQQKSSGELMNDVDGRALPLYARAFTIRENRPANDRATVTVVVADLWTCTIALRLAVLAELNRRHPGTPGQAPEFDERNLLIAGTHTHAAPGGYSQYTLYNYTLGGFEPGVFNTLVQGIANAVDQARRTARPGRLYVQAGPVDDCGANRSMAGFLQNPEAAAGAEPTDREMLLLKFTHDLDNLDNVRSQRAVGSLNWYAIHPTSLGMYNQIVSGDNKGWAAMLMEREQPPGFVAGFGNASAGDVSGNYRRDGFGNAVFERPLGGDLPAGIAIPPRLPQAQDGNIRRMKERGRQQADAALGLFANATTEVTGRLAVAHTWVDMSSVAIAAEPGATTFPAALGVSFGAGSSEDSIAYATMGTTDVDAAIPEGVGQFMFASGVVVGIPLLVAEVVATLPVLALAAAEIVPSLLTGTPMSPQAAITALPLVATLLADAPRSAVAAVVAGLALPGELNELDASLRWSLPSFLSYPAGYLAGHGNKPIMFPVGLATVNRAASASVPALVNAPCPLVPHVLPLHLLRIGNVALAGVPAEFTGMAGRRLKQTLASVLGSGVTHSAVAGYANGYSGYVTTREEYFAQQYEGASTLYGEHTLAAYQQVFGALASAIRGGPAVPAGQPFEPPVVVGRP